MSIWKRIFANNGKNIWDFGANANPNDTNPNESTTNSQTDTDFAAAVVALAAKMAAADGNVTKDESLAFRAAFPIDRADEQAFEQLFQMAKTSVLGFDGYAKKIGKKYRFNRQLLIDVLGVLFVVAAADGFIRPIEEDFLKEVSRYLGLTKSDYSMVSIQYFRDRKPDPHLMLGVNENVDDKTLKQAWLDIVTLNHPDNFVGRGEPVEFIKLANERTALANEAYAEIKNLRRLSRKQSA